MVDFKLHELTPGQMPTGPTDDWLVRSPSLHKWGRRVFLYDLFSSLGPYGRLKWVTFMVMLCLAVMNYQLHITHKPASPAPMPFIYTLRVVGFATLLWSFIWEETVTIPRMRLVE